MKNLNHYPVKEYWRKTIFLLMICLCEGYGQDKFSPSLKKENNRTEVSEMFSISVKDTSRFFKQYGSSIVIHKKYKSANVIFLKASNDLVQQRMALDSNVLFVDRHRHAVEEADIDFVNQAFNRISKAHHYFPELKEATAPISIKEQSFDVFNIDLINRSFQTNLTPVLTSQHATAMAVRIAGGGNSSANGGGVVPAARITSSDFENLLPDADQVFIDNNIQIQNHSYGVGIENYYGNEAFAYDEQVARNANLVHVFSVGNSGQSKPEDGAYKDLMLANITGNFKQAKNVILVNAVDTSFFVNALNSRGPAYDGRVKPELTAFGNGGTSEAAALVTGVCALVQEKYRLGYDDKALVSDVKAILIASADDIGQEGIDFIYGYGSVNAYKALQLIENRQIIRTTLDKNEQKIFPIQVAASVKELRVAVVWTDEPALPNADFALVNDVDAAIENGGTTYLPWALNTFAHEDSLSLPAKRKMDHLNTVEYFTIANPTADEYQLILSAPQLTTSSQVVSIAYWFEESQTFQWDYPSGSDVMEANGKEPLFWSSDTDQMGELSYQLNGGDWNVIKTNLSLQSYFHWSIPDTLSTARLKMKVGTEEFLSEEFLISPQPKLEVGYNCDTDFLLTWNSIPNVDSYGVYTLGEKYLQKITEISDTTITLSKSSGNFYFAIAPLLNNVAGIKSETINYVNQGSLCYINLFEAIRYDADRIEVHLNLSSIIHIDHIVIYKTVQDNQSEIFVTLNLPANQQFVLFDTELIEGLMSYQAELFFTDGNSLKSDLSSVFIESKGKAILYPNPVTDNDDLFIITEGKGLKFRILDSNGKVLITKELEEVKEIVEVLQLPAGIYFYQLVDGNRTKDSGRFVKI